MRTRVGVYAVAVHEARILLTQLAAHTPHAGQWTLPGGGMDHGEQPVDTLLRELAEETSLTGKVLGLLHAVSISGAFEDDKWLSVQLLYRVQAFGAPRVLEVNGSTVHAAWVPLSEVAMLARVPLVDVAVQALG